MPGAQGNEEHVHLPDGIDLQHPHGGLSVCVIAIGTPTSRVITKNRNTQEQKEQKSDKDVNWRPVPALGRQPVEWEEEEQEEENESTGNGI